MIVRYMPADPAGNLTAIVLLPVAPQARIEMGGAVRLGEERKIEL